jgi:hypothetical protein
MNIATDHHRFDHQVEVRFSELAQMCLAGNTRRLAPHDQRLIRPRFVPAMRRLALRFTGEAKGETG